MQKNIIFEDKHIIVAYKPAGIATQTARIGQQDMVSELKNYLSKKPEYQGKGAPYLGLIHRLDQPVSGLLVFAKTPKAASALSSQLNNGGIKKFYYAVVFGKPEIEAGSLENYIYKDGKTNQSLIVREDFPEAKRALLNYKKVKTLMVIETGQEASLVEIELITGRHHQIRAQMAHSDMPLLGDSKYGSEASKSFSKEIGCKTVALCAYKLILKHPVTGKEMTFERLPEGEIFLPFISKGF